MLDLNSCNEAILDNLDACYLLLKDLPAMVRMTPITQPYVFRYAGPVPEDEGITGVVIIAESHISLHTYPKKRFAFVDVFSCKAFDAKKATDYIVQFFESKSPVVHIQQRGMQFPSSVRLAS
jgi:S-adenosylmethionine decarboxylase